MALKAELAFTGLRIVEPERGEISEPLTVAMADGRIVYAGPDVAAGSTTTVEMDGRYATAGLVDMHVHLCHESRAHLGISFSHGEPEALAEYRVVQNLTEMQQHGVALVRDVGGRD
jgi:imidazolonepropionase-like amidohydrolase